MAHGKYVIGIDYGTDSVRSLIVDAITGKEISGAVFNYPQWSSGLYCNPKINQYRQHPHDFIEGLEFVIKEALKDVEVGVAENILGISVDTTGSTVVALDEEGNPLSLNPGFEENPNAMFVLWKDHTAIKEAEEINKLSKKNGTDYTKYVGGIYSSEWFWAKILFILRNDELIRQKAFSWAEHCDWITALLTGNTHPKTMKRSRCAAGHKAMWHESWGGLPPNSFFAELDPLLENLRENLYSETYTSDEVAGVISGEWADRLGLPKDVKIGVGGFDAHFGAVGGEISPRFLCKVMGTSTCDMMVVPKENTPPKPVKGICGEVNGSIIPGMIGLEAGQSAFGDVYAWFKKVIEWPVSNIINKIPSLSKEEKKKITNEFEQNIFIELANNAPVISLSNKLIAIDWLNGRRTPDANQLLNGAIAGLTLATDAPAIYRALVEATAFGTKKIIDRFADEGIQIDGIIALGGVAKKSPFVMQIVADVVNMPVKIATSNQTCALGAAMFASVAAGIYANVEEAQNIMGQGFDRIFEPIPENASKYEVLYIKYEKLGSFLENELK